MKITPSAVCGLVLAGTYAARAVTGVPAARAYREGRALEAAGRYAEAGPLMDRGSVGGDRIEALWRAGRTRMEIWDALPAPAKLGAPGDEALRVAAERFLVARSESPASTWYISALAEVYARRDYAAQERRPADLGSLDRGPWAFVGDEARVAIGLTRAAIDREPTHFAYRDQLVLLLVSHGLPEDAKVAIGASAHVLPDFDAHPEFTFEQLPRELVETFWREARALDPSETPLLPRKRYFLALGQLGRRLGHLEESEQDLRAAADLPGPTLMAAEARFHLALVLIDRGRFDEAEGLLARAVLEPGFLEAVTSTRARVAEMKGRWPEALERLQEVRQLRPRDGGLLLEFAAVAQKVQAWDRAEESLRWAIVVDPADAAPRRALVEMFLAKGEKTHARRALDDYTRAFGSTEDVTRLEGTLAASSP